MSDLDTSQKQAILASLDRIEQRELLGSSGRIVTLLQYLVQKELDGEGDRINAYGVAIDVLGRDKSFDPASNSAVRVEMLRLRRALEIYNDNIPDGCVGIDIPTHSYQPVFTFFDKADTSEENTDSDSENGEKTAQADGTGHIASPQHSASDQYADALASSHDSGEAKPVKAAKNIGIFATLKARIATWLDHFHMRILTVTMLLAIVGFAAVYFSSGMNSAGNGDSRCEIERPLLIFADENSKGLNSYWQKEAYELIFNTLDSYSLVEVTKSAPDCLVVPAYDLEMQYREDGNQAFVNLILTKTRSSQVLWSMNFMVDDISKNNSVLEMSGVISYKLAHPDGVIPNMALHQNWISSYYKSKYQCLMNIHDYYRGQSFDDIEQHLTCIRAFSRKETRYADIPALHAALLQAMPKVQEFRDEFDEAIKKSEQINPTDLEYLIATLRKSRRDPSSTGRHDMHRLLNILLAEHALSPNALNQAALTKGLYLGQWEEADELSRQAYAITVRNTIYDSYLLISHMVAGRYEEGKKVADMLRDDKVKLIQLDRMCLYALMGDHEAEVEHAMNKLREMGHYGRSELLAIVESYNFHESYASKLRKGIELAYQ